MNHPERLDAEADIVELVEHVPPFHEQFKDEETSTDFSSDSGAASPKYNITQAVHVNPWSLDYVGIPVNYFSVGLLLGGSVSLLYPVLVVREGVTSTFLAASTSIVTIFWSYKIVFGFMSDCFPIFGLKRKPYIICGWVLCASVLIALALRPELSAKDLVLMLTLANLGYVMADVAADGFMVWIAHREPIEKRGTMQTLIYASNKFGQIFINIVILFGFSGPRMNCPGFESDPSVPCTTDPHITSRNDLYPQDGWCHAVCQNSTFDHDLSISQFAMIIACINIVSIAFYIRLKEERVLKEPILRFLGKFWSQVKMRALWQILLYSMVSNITFGVINAAKTPANYVWLNLHTTQYQIMIIMEKTLIFVGLNVIRKYALNASWRKMVVYGSIIVTTFNVMYFIIVFNVWREAWFYIFTDVSQTFIYTLNFVASVFCMVEVAEPGFESITYALITTASNAVSPLSSVVSYQLLAFFPLLHEQQSIATDTPQVRMEFATLHVIVILINMSSLWSLPMLPRQKKEAREFVAKKEMSAFWGRFAVCSALVFLTYSTIVTFVTVAGSDVYGCFKIFGGTGCSAEESDVPAHMLVAAVLLYCYGVNFYLTFLPILQGRKKFSWSMFV